MAVSETGTLLQFPCAFPIKVVGLSSADFAQQITALVQAEVPDFRPETVVLRTSQGGKYLALTVTLTARSQAQLDALYAALTRHPGVKFVL
jgi:putative lipoic acid-binding regulatory protein